MGIPQEHELVKLANMRMPYGKYKGVLLIKLPENYLVWYNSKGFPSGTLGRQMQLILEIKTNGLENLIYPLIKK